MSRRERQKLLIAKQVAARLMGDEKYPPGTIVYVPASKQYGMVIIVAPFKHLPYLVRRENGELINFSKDGIANHYVSRSKYKASVRKRRKAGIQVDSLIELNNLLWKTPTGKNSGAVPVTRS